MPTTSTAIDIAIAATMENTTPQQSKHFLPNIQVNSAQTIKKSNNNIWSVQLISFQSPVDPMTHFERKYANAGKTLYHMEVDLGLRNSSQRQGLLYRLAMKL
jgi:hypothetical protein